jgi:hypothetical protein
MNPGARASGAESRAERDRIGFSLPAEFSFLALASRWAAVHGSPISG